MTYAPTLPAGEAEQTPVRYSVTGWDERYEKARTREVKAMRWVAVPNQQDGDEYTELVGDHPDGPAHFGAWIAILLVASKCPRRGTLVRHNETPHTATTLARITHFPEGLIETALTRLTGIGLLTTEVVEKEVDTTIPCTSTTESCKSTTKSCRSEIPVVSCSVLSCSVGESEGGRKKKPKHSPQEQLVRDLEVKTCGSRQFCRKAIRSLLDTGDYTVESIRPYVDRVHPGDGMKPWDFPSFVANNGQRGQRRHGDCTSQDFLDMVRQIGPDGELPQLTGGDA